MKVPSGTRAEIGDKLEEYSLNPDHREGRHKARVFASVLGITRENSDVLESAVKTAATSSGAVEERGDNGFGKVYLIRFPLHTVKGSAMILTAWIIRHEEDFPRLTTCYIL